MNRALFFWGGATLAAGTLVVGQVIPQSFPQYDLSVGSSILQPAALVLVDYSTWFIIAGIILMLIGLFA